MPSYGAGSRYATWYRPEEMRYLCAKGVATNEGREKRRLEEGAARYVVWAALGLSSTAVQRL
jgi:hypothetical protein